MHRRTSTYISTAFKGETEYQSPGYCPTHLILIQVFIKLKNVFQSSSNYFLPFTDEILFLRT